MTMMEIKLFSFARDIALGDVLLWMKCKFFSLIQLESLCFFIIVFMSPQEFNSSEDEKKNVSVNKKNVQRHISHSTRLW